MSNNLVQSDGDVPMTSVPVVFTADGEMVQILDMGTITENNQLVDTGFDSDAVTNSLVNISQAGDLPMLFQTSSGCHVNIIHTLTEAKSGVTLLQPALGVDGTAVSSPLLLPKPDSSLTKGVMSTTDTATSSKSVTHLQSSLDFQDVNTTLSEVPIVLSGSNLSLSTSLLTLGGKVMNEGAMKEDGSNSLNSHVLVAKSENGVGSMNASLSDAGDSFEMDTTGGVKNDLSPSPMFPEGAVLVETPQGLMLSVGDELRAVTLTENPDSQGNHLLSISNNPIPVALLSGCQQGVLLEEPEGGVYAGGGEVGVHSSVISSSPLSLHSQQVLAVSSSENGEPKRKNRGWPKGKKRKPPPQFSGPRAPMTGYVLFAINRRQEIKQSHPDLPFTEVTKVLGQEWSTMAMDKKQKFLDEAENDKQRYIDELKQFQKSDVYQTLVKKKRSNGDETLDDDENEEEDDNDELHCRVCKLYFSSLHNKKEHLLGKQHLQAITDQLKKEMKKQQREQDGDTLSSLDISDMGDNSHLFLSEPADSSLTPCSCWSKPVNVSGAISDFIHRVVERDQEIFKLRRLLQKHSQEKYTIYTQLQELKDYENQLRQDLRSLTLHGSVLTDRINTLKMVPALFGVQDFS